MSATDTGISSPEAACPAPAGSVPHQERSVARVLVLALVGALLIGSAGYVLSVALDPDPGFSQTMCVDSGCTFAMSAGMPMTAPDGRQVMPQKQSIRHSGPDRLVRDALSFLHIR